MPRSAPRPAPVRKSASAWSRTSQGRSSVQAANWAAHDTEIVPAASAAASTGWPASRFFHPTLPAADRAVDWVCHDSHTRADRCPSPFRPPPGTQNAASTRACTAVARDSATASARRQSACNPAGHSVGSAPARNSSAADRPSSAPAAVAGATEEGEEEAALPAPELSDRQPARPGGGAALAAGSLAAGSLAAGTLSAGSVAAWTSAGSRANAPADRPAAADRLAERRALRRRLRWSPALPEPGSAEAAEAADSASATPNWSLSPEEPSRTTPGMSQPGSVTTFTALRR